MTAAEIRIPTMAECHFEVPEIPTPVELIRAGKEFDPAQYARIERAAAQTVICWHPDADDCFNVSGMGKSKAESYRNMLDSLLNEYSDLDWNEFEAFKYRIEIARGRSNDSR